MRTIRDWAKNKLVLIKNSRRVRLLVLFIGISIVSGAVLLGGLKIHNQSNVVAPTPTPMVQETSNNGEVAGVATTNSPSTPTPTPVVKKALQLTPTPANTGQPPSNNNQSNNNSSNNSNPQQSSNNTTQTSSPTSTPIDLCSNLEGTQTQVPEGYEYQPSSGSEPSVCLPIPTPTPTPDNTPFTASMSSSNDGSNITMAWTANKTIKFCSPQEWQEGSGMVVGADLYPNSTTCSWSRPYNPDKKYYAGLKSIYDEFIEVGNTPPCNNVNGC